MREYATIPTQVKLSTTDRAGLELLATVHGSTLSQEIRAAVRARIAEYQATKALIAERLRGRGVRK